MARAGGVVRALTEKMDTHAAREKLGDYDRWSDNPADTFTNQWVVNERDGQPEWCHSDYARREQKARQDLIRIGKEAGLEQLSIRATIKPPREKVIRERETHVDRVRKQRESNYPYAGVAEYNSTWSLYRKSK